MIDEKKKNAELIDGVNQLYIDPGSRATHCFRLLKAAEVSHWDQVCFAAETLGHFAVMSEDKQFLRHVKEVLKFVYQLHYYHAPHVIGEPDLLTWNGRIHGLQEDTTQRQENADVPGEDEEGEEDPSVPVP